MTSKVIANNMVGDIDVTFPHANKNNSTQGFRTNYEQIGKIFKQLGTEVGDLHNKQITIVGDATGTSGSLGAGSTAPGSLNLVLANSGVTAGTYVSSHNDLTISVDSKGRVVTLTSTPTVTRPAVANTFKITSTLTSTGLVKEFVSPSFVFDEYGTLVSTDVETHKFGLTGHPLAKGSLLVGSGSAGEAMEFVAPNVSFNPSDVWALAWRPTVSNDFALEWYKLPAPTPVNPAQVVSILAGEGIGVSSDPATPTVSFDFTTFANYPDSAAIQTGTKLLMWDPATNSSYQIPMTKVFTVDPTSGQVVLLKVKDDTAPELGGDLEVGFRKIKSKEITGITLETLNAAPIILRNVTTISTTSGLPLDPVNYIVAEQRFPTTGPTFSSADTAAGITSATLKASASGQMFWDKSAGSSGGITSISPGPGIAFDPIGNITTTGTVKVDYSSLPLTPADINSDFLMVQTPGRDLIRNTISSVTWTTPQMLFVDPIYGNDDGDVRPGSPARPFRTISSAISSIPSGNPSRISIMLMPGTYVGNFEIDRQNISITSIAGPANTIVRGGVTIPSGVGSGSGFDTQGAVVLNGISFDISNLTNAPDRIITALDGIESFYAENCWFYQQFTEQGRPQEVASFAGNLTNFVHFDRCKFNGKIINYLVKPTDEFVDGRFRITNTQSDYANLLFVVVGNNTMSEITNVDVMGQVDHQGGILQLSNIGSMVGDFTDAEWGTDNDEDDLYSAQLVKTGILSSASYNTATLLTITNVSLRYYISKTYYLTSKISKTGSCYYTLSNVSRKSDIDTLVGLRYDAHGAPKVDQNDQVIAKTSTTGNQIIDAQYASTWSFELTGDTQFTIKSMELAPNAYANVNQATTLRVSVKQDSTPHAVTWVADTGTIVWDNNAEPASVSLTSSGYGVYEFLRINTIWFAKRIYAS
jgi:hypothetical protein